MLRTLMDSGELNLSEYDLVRLQIWVLTLSFHHHRASISTNEPGIVSSNPAAADIHNPHGHADLGHLGAAAVPAVVTSVSGYQGGLGGGLGLAAGGYGNLGGLGGMNRISSSNQPMESALSNHLFTFHLLRCWPRIRWSRWSCWLRTRRLRR